MKQGVRIQDVLTYLEEVFSFKAVSDFCINGLQVGDVTQPVKHVVTAVDISLKLLEAIPREAVDLIVVHHGLFWREPLAITGRYYRMMQLLMTDRIGLIGLHLPLDVHPKYGNNALIAKRLNLHYQRNFGDTKQTGGLSLITEAHVKGSHAILFEDFIATFTERIGAPLATVRATGKVRRVGICSGSGSFGLSDAKAAGCDTYITGDADHKAYHYCLEEGMNLICGGHTQTEIWGVKCLGECLHKRFGIREDFYHIPTGM